MTGQILCVDGGLTCNGFEYQKPSPSKTERTTLPGGWVASNFTILSSSPHAVDRAVGIWRCVCSMAWRSRALG